MADKYVNKVIYGGETLIDLTGDTAEASDVLAGKKFHDKTGAPVTGTCAFDSDTSDATAVAAEILATKTAYVNGAKVTGSMKNNGAVAGVIANKTQQYTVPQGYHDGSGKVFIDSTEQGKLIPANIREGITILGVEGAMSGTEDVTAESPTVTPKTTQQVVTPSTGYNYLAQVTVAAIPVTRVDNAQGGVTVTIAAA